MTSTPASPELDYAFLAEFAKVDNNSLTVIGASYTHIEAAQLPVVHRLFVAGRVRASQGAEPFEMSLTFRGPETTPELKLNSTVDPSVGVRPYDGKVGLTFAVGFDVPLHHEGLYEVLIELDDVQVRRLAFDVAHNPSDR